MALKVNLKTPNLKEMFKEMALEVEQDLNKGIAELTARTYAHVVEEASSKLKTTRQQYIDNLSYEEISPGLWVVTLDAPAMWIEEGRKEPVDMKPGLLKNATKTSKAGHKYRSIPFDYGKSPSKVSGQTAALIASIKSKLNKVNQERKKEGKEKIPFKKIEKNANGSPRVGKLHEFDFGGPRLGKGNTPALQGLSIYQSMTKSGNVRRDIMTFRTVSEGPGSDGKWILPPSEGKLLLDEAKTWAEREWELNILPEILRKWEL